MSKGSSPAAIGAFVVSGFALLVAAIVVVGGGKLFSKPVRFVCMFAGDVNGLKVGAPVKVKGVQIGSVEDIRLALAPTEGKLRQGITGVRIPVIIAIDRELITRRGATGNALGGAGFDEMVARGMRAQLNVESLLTGLLYVDLDLHMEAPLDLVLVPNSGPYREIPTVSTTMAAIQAQAMKALAKLEQIDFGALASSITEAADSMKQLTSSPELKKTLEALKTATDKLGSAAISIQNAVDHADQRLDPLIANLRRSSDEANATLRETRATMLDLRSTIQPGSPVMVNLNQALLELAETTRSIGDLTDFLQRNPAALVRGRYVKDEGQ